MRQTFGDFLNQGEPSTPRGRGRGRGGGGRGARGSPFGGRGRGGGGARGGRGGGSSFSADYSNVGLDYDKVNTRAAGGYIRSDRELCRPYERVELTCPHRIHCPGTAVRSRQSSRWRLDARSWARRRPRRRRARRWTRRSWRVWIPRRSGRRRSWLCACSRLGDGVPRTLWRRDARHGRPRVPPVHHARPRGYYGLAGWCGRRGHVGRRAGAALRQSGRAVQGGRGRCGEARWR